MVASSRTIAAAANVLLSHMSRSQALTVLEDLVRVQGNSSFETTMLLLREEVGGRDDVLLPRGVEWAAAGRPNEVNGFFGSTDLGRLSDPMLRAETASGAAQSAAVTASNHPGHTIFLTAVVAAYRRPEDRDKVLRLPLVPSRQL